LSVRKRWRRAQAYELDFWKRNAKALPDQGGEMPKHLDFVTAPGLEGKRVLEVGCGPMGVIYFVPGALRAGIDPLAREYMREFNFSTRGVHLLASMGENLPFRDGSFDVVIIGNVLDHVNMPGRTLDEVHRVLRPDGQLLVWMHEIPRWLVPARTILDLIDGGHPYHMTEAEAYELFRAAKLDPHTGKAVHPGLGWTAGWKAFLANLAMRNLLVQARPVSQPAVAAPA
jgi:SAM-dependent methyltransferase